MNKSFKDLMQPGKKNIGTILQVPSEELAEMLGHAGLELIILDMEHCPMTPPKIVSMVRACESVGALPFVRVPDVTDEDEMRAYIGKIVDKEAFDHKGLVYGMGHAVYSLSDPRAVVFKSFVQQLAMAKGRKADFDFYNTVERLAPQVIAEKRHIYKGVSTNVDFYSGFVYNMLGIPVELYTPMFAVARVVGWSAHRMEELVNVDKIIRPAYKSVMATRDYLPMENRG